MRCYDQSSQIVFARIRSVHSMNAKSTLHRNTKLVDCVYEGKNSYLVLACSVQIERNGDSTTHELSMFNRFLNLIFIVLLSIIQLCMIGLIYA